MRLWSSKPNGTGSYNRQADRHADSSWPCNHHIDKVSVIANKLWKSYFVCLLYNCFTVYLEMKQLSLWCVCMQLNSFTHSKLSTKLHADYFYPMVYIFKYKIQNYLAETKIYICTTKAIKTGSINTLESLVSEYIRT